MGWFANLAARRQCNCYTVQTYPHQEAAPTREPRQEADSAVRAQSVVGRQTVQRRQNLNALSIPAATQAAPAGEQVQQTRPTQLLAAAESRTKAPEAERAREPRFVKTAAWVAAGEGPPYILTYQETLRQVNPGSQAWGTAQTRGTTFTSEDLQRAKEENGYKLILKDGAWYALQLKDENGKQQIADVQIYAVSESGKEQPQHCRYGGRTGYYLALSQEWMGLSPESCSLSILPAEQTARNGAASITRTELEKAKLPPAKQEVQTPPAAEKSAAPAVEKGTRPAVQTESRFAKTAAWVAAGDGPPYTLNYQEVLREVKPGDAAWNQCRAHQTRFTAADLRQAKEENGYKIVFKNGAWYALQMKEENGKQQIAQASVMAVSGRQKEEALQCNYAGQTSHYYALRQEWIELAPGACTMDSQQSAAQQKEAPKRKKFVFPKVDLGLGGPEGEHKSDAPPNELQLKGRALEQQADEIEARGLAEAEKAGRQAGVARSCPSAYQRFYAAYTPYLPQSLPSREAVIEQTGLPQGIWEGSRTVVKPKDPDRPGIVMATGTDEAGEVNKVVAALRQATTNVLLKQFRVMELESTRANAVLLARQSEMLDDGLAEANKALAGLPDIVATNSVVQALAVAGGSSSRLERGAQGRLFARRGFDQGLAGGYSSARRTGQQALKDISDVVIKRCQAFAFEGAGEMENEAKRVKKKLDLIGFEIDFNNRWPTGIDYFIKTKDGGYQMLYDIGKNFRNEKKGFLPADVYGPFNVDVLTHYQKNGGITEAALPGITLKYGILPTKEGVMTYLSPGRYSPQAIAATVESMKKIYDTKRYPTEQEIQAALEAAVRAHPLK